MRLATAGNSLQGTVLGFDGGNSLFNLIDPGTPVTEIRMNPFVGIENEVVANGITLKQNVPNPAVDNTAINFELAEAGNVMIEIFDLTGKKVFELNEGSTAAGAHSAVINTSDLSAGMYYYTLTTNGKRASKKMTVAK